MDSERLLLYVGKPDDGSRTTNNDDKIQAATFSRFALPFSYKIELCDAKHADLFYQINPLSNISFTKRRKYFTRETAFTLYERAIWLDMCANWGKTSWGKEEITVTLRKTDFVIGMLPPRIVLFEAGDGVVGGLAELSRQAGAQVVQSGFLLVDLYFPEQKEKPILDDLLMLNEYFRHFGMPYDEHAQFFKSSFGRVPAIHSTDGPVITASDLDKFKRYFDRWADLLELPVKLEGKFYRLFPKAWAKNGRRFSYNEERFDVADNWQIYADNRAYVWSAAFLNDGGKALQELFNPKKDSVDAGDYGHWIKFLNVDNPSFDFQPASTHSNVSTFERNWADERTYKRWEHSGTWYGYCYHSGVVLAPAPTGDEKDNLSFAPFSSYYFDASLLLFYIRISLFRFSKELTRVFQRNGEEGKRRESLRKIRKQFSKFTILYRFPMVSNQQQMLEMFKLNRKYFDIDDFFKEVQHEIDNTHDFLESVEANELSTAANKLAKYGIPLAAGGLLTGIFGMSGADLVDCICGICTPWWDLIAKGAMVLFIVLVFWVWLGRDGVKK